ncbi:MAG: alpha/beta hydrolase family esterase [Pseudanabaena sp.]|uniref:alpha/beta hydrolase family esterase n=1 Tax=Pseudanabaena mucicola TaxID=71190 RepID=UPI0025788BAF|nr:PHB depolymerase family esterase [Pseudanabaena mucicola]MCA6580924.1 prolyl oligopeptidase family serine peptidase [Pseudanabaena sp. M34BS1SP1A06MG]MCA6594233.1 prolyl oligopeptidase family serine peptidase [Pseudanabaena sp. M38BS1SP1A06MG]MCA6598611.1 prolyl oligopeptidase family serine peptidase [Pseudanabaena sp. M046S1SP1A06QC]MCA6601925.1 prolyl oligopeptidase family serine peptidase [Pseudanabaena sp. M57BS1SP1A06MG]MCA6615240.1 prolyl oligopeptidase family serine peptidase [Pseuda
MATEISATELTFAVRGIKRRAILVNESTNQSLRPAVLVLHGGKGSAEEMRKRTGFDAIAVAENFSVIYAEGTTWGRGFHAWNTGYLQRQQVGKADDIGYFDTLIDLLVKDHHIDRQRIYMTGGSNGGMMTFVYAVKRPEKLAAIAPVVGAMFTFEKKPSVPLPILMINGQQDDEVPIEGGMSRNPIVRRVQQAQYRSLDDTVAFWVSANRSQKMGNVVTEGTMTTTTYPATGNGAITISIVDTAGGHGWPGIDLGRRGNTPIMSFNGAEKVWSFFKTQRRVK